jgi:hypothetical protein
MDTIFQMFSRGVERLIGRLSGPLNFRLFVMPTVATILAIRAGLRDAREGQPPYLWGLITNRTERRRLVRSGVKDVGKIFIMAVVLDTAYQLFVLRAFYIGQVLIVAVACAIVPYVLIRGPVTRLTRRLYPKKAAPSKVSTASVTADTQRRE